MRKIVKMSDGLITPDDLHIKRNQMSFDTCVIITAKNCKSEGSQEIKVCKNKTVLPGRVKLLEDNFPIKPDMSQHLFINSNVLGEYDGYVEAAKATGIHRNAIRYCAIGRNKTSGGYIWKAIFE